MCRAAAARHRIGAELAQQPVFLAHSPDDTTDATKLQNSNLNNYHYP